MNIKSLAIGLGLATSISGGVLAQQTMQKDDKTTKIEVVADNSPQIDKFEKNKIDMPDDDSAALVSENESNQNANNELESLLYLSPLAVMAIALGLKDVVSQNIDKDFEKYCKRHGIDIEKIHIGKFGLYSKYANGADPKELKQSIKEALEREIQVVNKKKFEVENSSIESTSKEDKRAILQKLKEHKHVLKNMLKTCKHTDFS